MIISSSEFVVSFVIFCSNVLSYMKLLDVPLGLVFNFREVKLADATSTLILAGANKTSTEGNKGNEEGKLSQSGG